MKSTYGILVLTLIIFIMIGCTPVKRGNEYPDTMKVIALNHDKDVVTIQTSTGFIYTFEGCEDYSLNDYVAVIMNDNGTPYVNDDIIVKARYSGYYERGRRNAKTGESVSDH